LIGLFKNTEYLSADFTRRFLSKDFYPPTPYKATWQRLKQRWKGCLNALFVKKIDVFIHLKSESYFLF
jgi:hypothetical protein|tara:strand:- start:107 stop:310 length:204 start_codon:yes stop_codon:yes gene_type:complete